MTDAAAHAAAACPDGNEQHTPVGRSRRTANFVATFEYTGLIWAAMWGFLIWGEIPDVYMIAGAALIVGAGL